MDEIEIREDATARRWLARAVLDGGLLGLRRRAPVSAVLTVAIALAFYQWGLPRRHWVWLVLPSFPILVSGALLVAYPLFLLPQRWVLDQKGIRGRGVRSLISTPWRKIMSW